MHKRREDLEGQFDLMMNLMAGMIDAQSGQPGEPQATTDHAVHSLAIKLFMHLRSARTLIDPSEHGYIDHASIAVLTRSSIECFLVMNWLNADGDHSLQTFRYDVWHYAGMKKRSKLYAADEYTKARRQHASDLCKSLLVRIESSEHYARFSDNQKKSIRKGNWDAGWHWNDLAVAAGLHHIYFTTIYSYLSGYAHSDFISSLQIQQAVQVETQYELALSGVQHGLIMLAHLCHLYARVFPAAQSVLDADKISIKIVKKWYLRAADMDFVYPPEGVAGS